MFNQNERMTDGSSLCSQWYKNNYNKDYINVPI